VLRGKLALCEGAKNATSEAVTRLEELVASPLARMAERLENRDEGSVDREARLASVCATRGTRMLSAAVVMVRPPETLNHDSMSCVMRGTRMPRTAAVIGALPN